MRLTPPPKHFEPFKNMIRSFACRDTVPHPPTQLCHPSPRCQCRHLHPPGHPRSCRCLHHHGLPASHRQKRSRSPQPPGFAPSYPATVVESCAFDPPQESRGPKALYATKSPQPRRRDFSPLHVPTKTHKRKHKQTILTTPPDEGWK